MPELPDVELYKRRLDAGALHRAIEKVTVSDARILGGLSPRALAKALQGTAMEQSRRHGKHLLVRLSDGRWLTLHFGMTGTLQCFDDMGDDPPYDRVRLDLADGRHLAYTSQRLLGRVGLAEDANAFIESEGLGPDALDPGFDLAAFEAALSGRRGVIKSALMDQSLMAGIGNIFADEILFQARVHPASKLDRLEKAEIERLYRATKDVLETAIAHGAGSEQFLDRLPAGYILPQRKKGGRCPRCDAEIESLKIGGRTSYFCPRCQKPR